MPREYQLIESESDRLIMATEIRIKLRAADSTRLLYPPLTLELEAVFRSALEQIEAGIPFSKISELSTVTVQLNTERCTVARFAGFKRVYQRFSLSLANASSPPGPAELRAMLSLLSSHPAVSPKSTTAYQLVKDLARDMPFTATEHLHARYLWELEDTGWTCSFWIQRFHSALRRRYLKRTNVSDQIWMRPEKQPFDQPPQILFRGRTFLFTGKFQYGSRSKCRQAVVDRSGLWVDTMGRSVDCLVVAGGGELVTDYSNKVGRWTEFHSIGEACLLVSEQQWIAALNRV